MGNIDIGKDLRLASLQANYNAVVFAYGASKDLKLGITGEENLKGIYSARAFVGWYNGLPEYADLAPDLSAGEEAIVVGQGNVALDIARTLLCDIDHLRKTDMTEQAIATFSKSRVKRVRVVGRRGPMQAAFTIKEVRELMKLPSVTFEPIDPSLLPSDPKSLPRTARRLTELLQQGSTTATSESFKKWSLNFFLSPTSFNASSSSSNHLSSMTFAKNYISDGDLFSASARVSTTDEKVNLPASVAFRSIGYRAEAIPGMQDVGIPFDTQRGVIPNDGMGRIFTGIDNGLGTLPGMYCSGWVKRGPRGIISSTMEDAFSTAMAIAEDWETGKPFLKGGDGWEALKWEVDTQKVRSVSWEDWKRIDAVEKERGMSREKEREKITRVEDMLKLLDTRATRLRP